MDIVFGIMVRVEYLCAWEDIPLLSSMWPMIYVDSVGTAGNT